MHKDLSRQVQVNIQDFLERVSVKEVVLRCSEGEREGSHLGFLEHLVVVLGHEVLVLGD